MILNTKTKETDTKNTKVQNELSIRGFSKQINWLTS